MKTMKRQILAMSLATAAVMSGQETLGTFLQLNGRSAAADGFGRRVVKGKPLSATEEQHVIQVLSDGTRIETRQTTRIYRDGEGRMRLEDATPGGQTQAGFEFGSVTIVDPVANTRTALNL